MDVYFTGSGLMTPVGLALEQNWNSLCSGRTNYSRSEGVMVARLPEEAEEGLESIRRNSKYLKLADRLLLIAISAARQAVQESGLKDLTQALVLMGSSRGAVRILEDGLDRFQNNQGVDRFLGAMTHFGTIGAAIAADIGAQGLTICMSAACTSGMHAIGVARSLLQTGLSTMAIAGGADSPLTPFTLGQLSSLGILATGNQDNYPCRPAHESRTGTVFGEGAACLVLESKPKRRPLAQLLGYGAAVEMGLKPGTSETSEGLKSAIQQALLEADLRPSDIDLIVGHATGTRVGDVAEIQCYREIFGEKPPALVLHKWCMSHLMGASSAASTVLAIKHLQEGVVPPHPYMEKSNALGGTQRGKFKHALISSVGYGGNAGALILKRVGKD